MKQDSRSYIRKSEPRDIPRMLEIFEQAKEVMRADGNLCQWTNGYPSSSVLMDDIGKGNSYVICRDGKIVGTFAFIIGKDPTYAVIYDGGWKDDTATYGTIHRLAGCHGSHGIAKECFDYCRDKIDNLRVDTHSHNRIMQHCILKAGFEYCGVIHLANGDPRLAYQKIDMTSLKIHVATPGDIPLIQGMAQNVFRKTYAQLISPQQMEFMLDWMYSEQSLMDQIVPDGKTFFIATVGAVPAGYVSIERQGNTPDGRPLIHLQKLYLLPEYQGRGYGKELFNQAAGYILEQFPSGARIELNVNRGNKAVGFYEAMGMTRDREGDFAIGNGFYMTDYIYVKDLCL